MQSLFPRAFTSSLARTTLPYQASWHGCEASVAAFLGAGVDPAALNNVGQTPLYYARKNGHESCVALLREEPPPTPRRSVYQPPTKNQTLLLRLQHELFLIQKVRRPPLILYESCGARLWGDLFRTAGGVAICALRHYIRRSENHHSLLSGVTC